MSFSFESKVRAFENSYNSEQKKVQLYDYLNKVQSTNFKNFNSLITILPIELSYLETTYQSLLSTIPSIDYTLSLIHI